jgi:hypothetical protein
VLLIEVFALEPPIPPIPVLPPELALPVFVSRPLAPPDEARRALSFGLVPLALARRLLSLIPPEF